METAQTEQPTFTCGHEESATRKRVLSNGAKTFALQCLRCGTQVRAVKKASVSEPWNVPPWDEELAKRWSNDRTRQWTQWHEQEKGRRDQEFWDRYDAHITSPKWYAIREKVIRRCRNVCEGCGERPVNHVHHLTYARLGDEMLFDLVGVCRNCHSIIHGRPL